MKVVTIGIDLQEKSNRSVRPIANAESYQIVARERL